MKSVQEIKAELQAIQAEAQLEAFSGFLERYREDERKGVCNLVSRAKAAQKKLEGSKFCPIISGCVELSEKEILESDLDTILEKIYSKIEEYTDGLANSLNKLDEEQKSCTE